MRLLHVSVSNFVHSIYSCCQFFQSPQLCLSASTLSNFSCVALKTDKTATAVFGSRPSSCVIKKHHHGSGAWFVNQDCWWNLVLKPSIEHLCWETDDRLVHAEVSVETAHSTVNRLVLSRTTKTI